MRKVIVAAASSKFSATLEKLLGQGDISVQLFCKSGSEVLSLQNDVDDAVLVCGPLKDIPAIYLARQIPESWDAVLLLDSNQPFPYYVSNITPITLPVNRMEFLETVRSIAEEFAQTFASKTTAKLMRNDEDKEVIERAKRKIMTERGISEGDAHKLLQRYSMNLGISMVASAMRFIGE
ncbi:MAG: ANTAR domain-containing protein [Ruminococcus sp.]|nr:ANTAR domain-containing protein [Ruminococcus sp.]